MTIIFSLEHTIRKIHCRNMYNEPIFPCTPKKLTVSFITTFILHMSISGRSSVYDWQCLKTSFENMATFVNTPNEYRGICFRCEECLGCAWLLASSLHFPAKEPGILEKFEVQNVGALRYDKKVERSCIKSLINPRKRISKLNACFV